MADGSPVLQPISIAVLDDLTDVTFSDKETMRADIVPGEIRPDWDLAGPGVRENWEAGDHSMHHPSTRPATGGVRQPRTRRAPQPFQEVPDHGIPRHHDHPCSSWNAEQAVDDIRTREAAHSRELVVQGHLLRLWRPPLRPGEWRSLGLFAAARRPARGSPRLDAATGVAHR